MCLVLWMKRGENRQRSLPMALLLSSGEREYRTSDGGAGLSFNIMV